MIKVVHLITLLEFGGAQGNTIHTVKNLNPQKFETHLWAGHGAYWDQELTQELGQKGRLRFFSRLVRQTHLLFDFLIIFDLIRALKEAKPTILHTHSSKAGIVGRWAAKMSGVPIVIHTFHGFGFNDQQKPWTRAFFIWLERISAIMADQFIFVSEANLETARRLKIGKTHQYLIIRSGIPIKILSNIDRSNEKSLRKSLLIPPENKIVTTVSAFKPQKNLDDFIKAAGRIHEKRKDVTFLLIGDGEERPKLETLIQKENLKNCVSILGWRKDAAEIVAISDIFVLTSLWEGLPRALLEALILGVPAVCYDTDGVRDILPKGGGAIIPQGQVSLMAEKVLEFLQNPDLWKKHSEEGKKLVTREFDIDDMVLQQEKLYQSLLSSKNKQS